jgi:hypothetical protein
MFKNKKKSIAIVLALSAVFSAAAYASGQCSYAAQLKCMMGMSEYCSVRCERN